MESRCSLPRSQKLATASYPDPDESSPQTYHPISLIHFYIILSPTSKYLKWPFPSRQVRSQTMNTVGAAASTASAHMYIL
jgi:hypothetical protein